MPDAAVAAPAPNPTLPPSPLEAVPPPLPPYDFAEMADRSRSWAVIPGWRLSRNGRAKRPDRATIRTYAAVFLARMRTPEALLEGGLPRDPHLKRLVVRYADAVHGRIHWYEQTLQERNFWFQLFRGFTYVLVAGAVVLTFQVDIDEAQIGYVTAVGAALSNFVHFVLKSRNEQAQVEAYIAALSTLKKQLADFENAWDDPLQAKQAWPPGFAIALAAGPGEAEQVEEVERIASLRAVVGGAIDAATGPQQWQASINAVATARAGLSAGGGLTPLQKAELDVEAARAAEERARTEDWGATKDLVLQGYRQARIEAETRAERLKREDALLQDGRG